MGQAVGLCGSATCALSLGLFPAQLPFSKHMAIAGSGIVGGLAIDLASDLFAKHGKVVIEREVILNAQDVLKHCSSWYCTNDANPVSRFVQQKHEWLVLESEQRMFYAVQKNPGTGDVTIEVRNTLRAANDCGLRAAKRPLNTGEIRLHRMDHDFDLPDDLQVAYVIAWARKEDPRWGMTTENSKHFTYRLRFALNDF